MLGLAELWGELTIFMGWSGDILKSTSSAPLTVAGLSLCLANRGVPTLLGWQSLYSLRVSNRDPRRDGRGHIGCILAQGGD